MQVAAAKGGGFRQYNVLDDDDSRSAIITR